MYHLPQPSDRPSNPEKGSASLLMKRITERLPAVQPTGTFMPTKQYFRRAVRFVSSSRAPTREYVTAVLSQYMLDLNGKDDRCSPSSEVEDTKDDRENRSMLSPINRFSSVVLQFAGDCLKGIL